MIFSLLEFLNKIFSFIKELNNFNILLKLFDISNNGEQRDYEEKILLMLQEKLIELYKNVEDTHDTTFEKYLIEVMYYSDQKNAKIQEFLRTKLHPLLNFSLINKIYIKFLSMYKDEITPELKKFITDFFINNPKNSNPDTLLYLIKECPELRNDIFQNIEKYNIQKEEFWRIEESDNYILLNKLLTEGFLQNEELSQSKYIEKTINVISSIQQDIKNGEIRFEYINIFFATGKSEELLKRLNTIYLNNKEQAEKAKIVLCNSINIINKDIKDLQVIYEDLSEFLSVKEKETLSKINEIKEEIKNGNINVYENKLKDEIKKIIEKYKNKAEERTLKKKSAFFSVIYQKYKDIYKKDEEICINETEKNFDKLINIFYEQGIQSLDIAFLQICLNTIKGRKKTEIENEINILIKIFDKQIDNVKYNKDDIINCFIILSRKEDVYNIAIAILLFIETIGAKKSKFSEVVKDIILKLEDKNSNNEKIIKRAIDDLKSNSVDIEILYDDNFNKDNYLNMLLKLRDQPDAIIFLLNKDIEFCRNLQELVGEMDDGFLNANDILEFEKCVDFISRIGNEETIKNKTDIETITSFQREVNNYKNIELFFIKYINNYSEIKNLVSYRLNKSEASKKKNRFYLSKIFFHFKKYKRKIF